MIAMYGATAGKVGLAKRKFTINQAICAIVPNGKFHSEFFFYYFIKIRDKLLSERFGGAQPNLNQQIIKNLQIPLPPLAEQKKIAAVLSAVQEAREKTAAVIAAAKTLKKSLMKHLFTYGPVPVGARRAVPLRKTEIGPVPERWEVVRLGEIIAATQYGISMRGNREGRYPILRMNNLVEGRVDVSDLQYVDLDEHDLKKFKLKENDLLFNRTNSYELVGKTSIFDLSEDFVFASYLIRVEPNLNKTEAKFLNYYLNWEKTQSRLKMLATRGVSQSNINATKLKDFRIPLPTLRDQATMAHILSSIDQKIAVEENKKRALEALFKTLLNELMTGRRRVQDLDL